MRTQRRELVDLLVSVLVAPLLAVVAACGESPRRSNRPVDTALVAPSVDTAAPATDTATTPRADTTATQPPPALSVVLRADSAAGDSLFHGKGRCFTCHGAHGEGIAKLGTSLVDSVWINGDGSLRSIQDVIANGVAAPRAATRAMPAFGSALTPAELTRTAAYVYTLSHPGAAVDDTSHVNPAAPESTSHADSVPPPR